MAFLRIKDLSKTFQSKKGEIKALDDVNAEVEEEEFVAFLGPSGCGKTTLLKTVAGLIQPTSGRIEYREGKKLDRGDLGFVFQDYALFDWKTAGENLMIAQKLAGKEPSVDRKKEFLGMVELTDFEGRYPSDLSGGMRQRLALARTLIYDPDLVLMDEPFAALDELTKERLYSSFMEILEDTEKTVIYVTHDIEEAYMFADRLVVMSSGGRIVENIDIDGDSPRSKEVLSSKSFKETRERVMERIGEEI
jgi:NitT/TauT family transport system ATP-binding protein